MSPRRIAIGHWVNVEFVRKIRCGDPDMLKQPISKHLDHTDIHIREGDTLFSAPWLHFGSLGQIEHDADCPVNVPSRQPLAALFNRITPNSIDTHALSTPHCRHACLGPPYLEGSQSGALTRRQINVAKPK